MVPSTTNRGLEIKSIVVCNRAAVSATFRISVAVRGATDDVKQYIMYDVPIVPNDSIPFDGLSIGLGPGDIVRVYASLGNLSFSFFGDEWPSPQA